MHPKTLLSRLVVACALARDYSVRCVLVCSAEHVSGSSRTADGLAQGWSVGRRAQQAESVLFIGTPSVILVSKQLVECGIWCVGVKL
jgi:hypothetical protein